MIEQKELKKRDASLDILKGFGIVFMITAHTLGPNNFFWNAVYTFHMPLFFITTGFLYKHNNLFLLFRNNFSHLIFPYLSACIIIIIISQIRHPHSIIIDFNNILSGFGPGWFLLALFWARIEFHLLLTIFPKWHLFITLIISSCISFLVRNFDWTSHLAFYPSLVSLFFLSVGYYTRQNKLFETRNLKYFSIIAFIFWFISFMFGKVEMSHCLFKLNIIDFAGSISGTYIFYKLSQIINKNKVRTVELLKEALEFTGRYSLVILFFHIIDYCVYPWYILETYISNKIILLTLININRFLFVYVGVIISLNSKLLRSLFNIH